MKGKTTSKSIDLISEKPTHYLRVRVSKRLKDAVLNKAEELNMDESKFIRKVVVEALDRETIKN